MTKPRTIKAWGVFTKRGTLQLTSICSTKSIAKGCAKLWDEASNGAPHTVRRVTITVEE
ncbi:MAG: hypothetical protein JW395_0555 [Nitrospira sp.]|nr:hypothetical protein [Nitrospira sp.]